MRRYWILIGCLVAGCAAQPAGQPGCESAGTRRALAEVVAGGVRGDPPRARRDGVFTRLHVMLPSTVTGVCRAGLAVHVPVFDPLRGDMVKRRVRITKAGIDHGRLRLLAAGPVTAGSRLELAAGALRWAGGHSGAGALTVVAPLSPRQGTLWFKAYVPQDTKMLPQALYYRKSANPRTAGNAHMRVAQPRMDAPGALKAALRQQYAPFINHGQLSRRRAAHYLALTTDPRARAVFTGPDGVFRPLLMAAVLANAGTIGEPAIAAIIEGGNVTGRPARMIFDPHVKGHLARSGVVDNRWIIRVNPNEALGELLALLAPILGAHEACHQDNRAAQNEELIASYAGYIAAGQQYLAHPALARAGTRLSRILNARILAMLNSGSGDFPAPGLLPAPLRQPLNEVLPHSLHAGQRPSLDALLRTLYRRTPDVDTPGNAYVDGLVSTIVDSRVVGVDFTRALINRLDQHSSVIDASAQRRLMKILAATPAP